MKKKDLYLDHAIQSQDAQVHIPVGADRGRTRTCLTQLRKEELLCTFNFSLSIIHHPTKKYDRYLSFCGYSQNHSCHPKHQLLSAIISVSTGPFVCLCTDFTFIQLITSNHYQLITKIAILPHQCNI